MNLKILKLRSGEEIACQVIEENDVNVKVTKPMVFRYSVSTDSKGRTIDITTLHDWLVNSENKSVDIPVNHIAFVSEPNKDTMKLYEMESTKEFEPDAYKTSITANDSSDSMDDSTLNNDLFGSFLSDLLGSTSSMMEPKEPRRRKKRRKPILPPDMVDENELDRHMIMMQLYIPSEAIMNMITSGIIKPETLLDMIEEVKKRNRFTGDEKNRQDFGNKLSDWNPDPNSDDYSK
jgi:hypothetical protein